MFLFLSLIACGPKSTQVEPLFPTETENEVTYQCASDNFEPIGSFCIDAMMSYYMDAECNTIRQYGEDVESGIIMECIDPVKVTDYSRGSYYVTTVESVYSGNEVVDVADLACMDDWFAVYLR